MILILPLPPRAEPAGYFWSGGIPGEKKQEAGRAGGIKDAGRETGMPKERWRNQGGKR